LWACFCVVAFSVCAQRPLGADVSHYQGTIDWPTVKRDGVIFAWAKATEGTSFTDPYFTANETHCKSASVLIGAYHFARPDSNVGALGADAEAAYFWSIAKTYITGGGGYLMPMLDIEQAPGSSYTKASLSIWVNRWCNDIVSYGASNGVVVKPVIYTFTSYASTWLNSTVTQWPLWMASYPSNPDIQNGAPASTSPWNTWDIWQYADTNWSGGDSDVYNGTTNAFISKFVIGGAVLTNITANVGAAATFHVTAGTAGSVAYQWFFNTNVIDGAASSNYTIASVQLTNAGAYSVVVSNSLSGVSTATAYLSVLAPLDNAPGAAVSPPGMINWWTADGNTRDIYGADNGVSVNGLSYAPGVVGLAFHFDGASSYLQLTNPVTPLAGSWTACFWVNRQDAPQTSAALLGDSTNILKLEQYGAGRAVGFSVLGSNDWTFSPPYVVPQNTWTHLAFVASGGVTTLYVNGVREGTAPAAIPLGRASMGADGHGDNMLGSIDEPMLFNTALSEDQVLTIYNSGSAGLIRTPQFVTATHSADGSFGLNFEGLSGKSVTIYWTTNFTKWTPLVVIANPYGTNQYTDTTVSPLRFYRVQ
jgi:GH25 family lysozyme M1 (1,4-beta-N-acetylmuramidase)